MTHIPMSSSMCIGDISEGIAPIYRYPAKSIGAVCMSRLPFTRISLEPSFSFCLLNWERRHLMTPGIDTAGK